MRLRVSAIIPATNRPPTLARCLESIRAAVDPPDEVIVVERPRFCGPAGARNCGARKATGDILVFIDSDVDVHPDAFRRIRTAFETEPELTALFGSYDAAPEDPGAVSTFRNLLHHHIHQSSPGNATTFWAGLGAIRHAAFVRASGFDPKRFRESSVEDIDLGLRLSAAGANIRLDPQLQGKHLKVWTLKAMLQTDFYRRGTPWVRILLESRTDSKALNLAWRHRISAAASLVLLGSLWARRPTIASGSGLTLILLNRSFYGLLARRGGLRFAATGVGLHVLHLIAAAGSVPAGAMLHVLGEEAVAPSRVVGPRTERLKIQ